MGVDPSEGEPERSPAEAFGLLGNEIRMDILHALWESQDPLEGDAPIGFSELYDLVGADDSGQFNYHLDKLVGQFVDRMDDGYELTPAGANIVEAVIAGTTTRAPTVEQMDLDESCFLCGGRMQVSYDASKVSLLCTECEGMWPGGERSAGYLMGIELPPAGLAGRDPSDLLDAAAANLLRSAQLAFDGVCPSCTAPIEPELVACDSHEASPGSLCDACDSQFLGQFLFVCGTCKGALRAPSYGPVLAHPAATAFLYDHGIVHTHDSLETLQLGAECEEELVSTDPPRLRVTLPVGDDAFVATVDGTLPVNVERD